MKFKKILISILSIFLITFITTTLVSAKDNHFRTSDYFSDTNDYDCCSNDLYVYVESTSIILESYKIEGLITNLLDSDISLIKRNISINNLKGYLTNVSADKIKNKKVILSFDITIKDNGNNYTPSGNYTTKILLPKESREYKYIDVLSINDDTNMITIYKTKRIANWISFETDEFTSFYLLADELTNPNEKEVNLWSFIILTFILIVITLILIAWVTSVTKRLKMMSVTIPLMIIVKPYGGLYILIILLIILLLLLLYLIYLFLRFKTIGHKKGFKEIKDIKELNQVKELTTIITKNALKPSGKIINKTKYIRNYH